MNKIIFIFITILLSSCTLSKLTPKQQIANYYEGFRNADYDQIQKTLADSLTITEGSYVMTFTPETYYKQFQWDSVFKPEYKVVEVKQQDGKWVATVSVSSLRFEFLKNNPLTTTQRFHFISGKISKVENIDFIDVDWEVWTRQKENLVDWIKINHPELDGFMEDLSKKGAMNYLKAIELYENSHLD